jgi:hypothetical protein
VMVGGAQATDPLRRVGASCQLESSVVLPSHATSDSTVKETLTWPSGAQKGAGGIAVTFTVGGPEPVSLTTSTSWLEQTGSAEPVTLTVKLTLKGIGRPGGVGVLQL